MNTHNYTIGDKVKFSSDFTGTFTVADIYSVYDNDSIGRVRVYDADGNLLGHPHLRLAEDTPAGKANKMLFPVEMFELVS